MKIQIFFFTALLGLTIVSSSADTQTNQSAVAESTLQHDARMAWWREARFGMFVHWGLYSGLAGTWDGKTVATNGGMEWIQQKVGVSSDIYAQRALPLFQPKPGFAREWAALAKAAGMKYVVFTTKHHEGFGLYASKFGDYNADAKLNRDLVKEIVEALHAEGLRVGFYHSLIDWNHPQYAYARSKQLPYPQRDQPYPNGERDHAKYIEYLHNQVGELMSNYGPVDILWWDYSAVDFQGDEAWRAFDLMKEVRAKQPGIIMNNRLFRVKEAGWAGMGEGNFLSQLDTRCGDFITPEQRVPATGMPGLDWESCMTMNTTWGYSDHDHAWKSSETLIRKLCEIASKGGNFLLNIGPKGDGSVPPESVAGLKDIGRWMQVNGEAIYGTQASPFGEHAEWCCTTKPGKLYLHIFNWPANAELRLPELRSKVVKAYLLTDHNELKFSQAADGLVVSLPAEAPDKIASVVCLEIADPAAKVSKSAGAQAAVPPPIGSTHLTSASDASIHHIDPDSLDNDQIKPDLSLAYKNVGGLDLPMAVFLPKDCASLAERRPVVLCVQGGGYLGWTGGDYTTWDGGLFAPHARYFTARGAVAVTVMYRSVPRPNRDPEAFEKGPSLFDIYADCRSAVRYLRKNADRFGIDPQRIAALGDSASGHMVACLATIDRFDNPGDDLSVSARPNLVIACNPGTDFSHPKPATSFVPATPRAWEGDHPLSRIDRGKAISPLWNVSTSSVPTLIMHGTKDDVVPLRHSTDFYDQMKKAGVACRLDLIPEARHGFIELGLSSSGTEFISAMATVDQFLTTAGFLVGKGDLAFPSPHGWLTTIACDRISGGRVPGSNGLSLAVPAVQKSGVATVEVVEDNLKGRVLKIGARKEGLALAGQQGLGSAATVSLWIKPEKATSTLVRRYANIGNSTGFKLALSNNVVTLQMGTVSVTGGTLAPNTWCHIVASIAPDRAALYLDDKLVGEQPLAGVKLIGNHLIVGEDYAGLISEVKLFDEAKTPEEIANP